MLTRMWSNKNSYAAGGGIDGYNHPNVHQKNESTVVNSCIRILNSNGNDQTTVLYSHRKKSHKLHVEHIFLLYHLKVCFVGIVMLYP